MNKVTVTQEDGTTVDFFPQSYTDAAVSAAVAAATTPVPTQTVHVAPGETVEIVSDQPASTDAPAA